VILPVWFVPICSDRPAARSWIEAQPHQRVLAPLFGGLLNRYVVHKMLRSGLRVIEHIV
jgi:hypothetical protein